MSKLLKLKGIDRDRSEVRAHMRSSKFGEAMHALWEKLNPNAVKSATATRKRKALVGSTREGVTEEEQIIKA